MALRVGSSFLVFSQAAAATLNEISLVDAWAKWKSNDFFDFVLDARTDDDLDHNGTMLPGWNKFHLPKAVSGHAHTEVIKGTTACQSKTILVHCWLGPQGKKLGQELVDAGFTKVYAIKDAGVIAWKAANYSLTINEARSPSVSLAWAECASSSTGSGRILSSTLNELSLVDAWTKWKSNVFFDFVLDVRTDDDLDHNGAMLPGWNKFHLPQAVSGHSHTEVIKGKTACQSKTILVHCWLGPQGKKVAQELVDAGFTKVYAIKDAGIIAWKAANYTLTIDEARSPSVSLAWAKCPAAVKSSNNTDIAHASRTLAGLIGATLAAFFMS